MFFSEEVLRAGTHLREHFGATQWYTNLFSKRRPWFFESVIVMIVPVTLIWGENLSHKYRFTMVHVYLEYQEYHIRTSHIQWIVQKSCPSWVVIISFIEFQPSLDGPFLNHPQLVGPVMASPAVFVQSGLQLIPTCDKSLVGGYWNHAILSDFPSNGGNSPNGLSTAICWEWNHHPNWLHHFSEGWRAKNHQPVFEKSLRICAWFSPSIGWCPAKRLGEMPI